MSNSIKILKIKEDKTHVLVTFDEVNDEFIDKLKTVCIASDRDFELDGTGTVKFKHLTSKTYAESQARKLIREVLADMEPAETTENSEPSEPKIPKSNISLTTLSHGASNEVVVTDISMPFISMVIFMIKWAVAAIPAFIILFFISLIFTAIFGGIFA